MVRLTGNCDIRGSNSVVAESKVAMYVILSNGECYTLFETSANICQSTERNIQEGLNLQYKEFYPMGEGPESDALPLAIFTVKKRWSLSFLYLEWYLSTGTLVSS